MATQHKTKKGITINSRPNIRPAQVERNRERLAQIAAQARKAVVLDRNGQVIGEIERQR